MRCALATEVPPNFITIMYVKIDSHTYVQKAQNVIVSTFIQPIIYQFITPFCKN